MKPLALDDMPHFTEQEIDAFLNCCRRSPHTNMVWGNDTVGRIILSLRREPHSAGSGQASEQSSRRSSE